MLQFDTHKVYKKFKDAGIEDRAADAFVEAINDARTTDLENLATKQDLADVKNEGFDKIYNLGKFILAIVLIHIGIKVLELFLPRLFQ